MKFYCVFSVLFDKKKTNLSMPPTLSAKFDEKEMHTLRLSVKSFKKVSSKLSIKQGL